MFRSLAIVLFASGIAAPSKAQTPLASAQSVRNLTSEQAAQARAVRITGVITHVNPHLNDFFIQDDTAGIYVGPSKLAIGLSQGDRVEVEGVSDAGEFAPCINPTAVRIVGPGKLPDPLPFNLSVDDARWLDGQWVLSWAVVREVTTGNGYTQLQVYSTHGTATVLIPGERHADVAKRMSGLSLSFRGVCVPRFNDRVVSGPPRILCQNLPMVPIHKATTESGADAPPRMIDHLMQFHPAPFPGARRVKIAGVVTACPVPGLVFLQDSSGAAAVQMESAERVPVGVRIEAEGLLAIEGRRIILTRATVRVMGPGEIPAPIAIRASDLSSGVHDGTVVRMEGVLEDVRNMESWTVLTLSDGATRFEAYLPGTPSETALDRFELGSRLAVVGVPTLLPQLAPVPVSYGLSVNQPSDLTLLAGPAASSWWSGRRVTYLIGGFGAVLLLGSAWLIALRSRVRRATAEIQMQYAERERLESQLRQAAKLEAVGRLAGGIAHDFNNLITVINGCADLLAEDAATNRALELAHDIQKAGSRAAALTSQLLTFSRKQEVVALPVDLNEVVRDAAKLLGRVIGDDIVIDTRLTPVLPAVRGEPGLLHQVIMNLAVNAKDAMPTGGTLTIRTDAMPDGRVALTVADTGHGMDEATQTRLFEPFFTTKEVGKGTGLGLSTVYGIVQALDGKVRVQSQVGIGTTFEIVLHPAGERPDGPLVTPRRPAGAGEPRRLVGKTVLLVEDNELVRKMLVTGLTSEGARILEAGRAAEGLRIAAEHREPIDVLVTDVVMPGASGPEMAEQMRAVRPEMRVLFMSGYSADEALRRRVEGAEVEFLQKPFTPDQLSVKLLEVMQGSEIHLPPTPFSSE